MLCAIMCAERGAAVTLIEHNERLGKKLYITGKGRCNFTNDCSPDDFLANVVTNPKFLFSASRALTSSDVISLFESYGVRAKTERGRRVFPESDRSAEVIDALVGRLRAYKVKVLLNTEVREILTQKEDAADSKKGKPSMRVLGVLAEHQGGKREEMKADAVVLATGGLSYPSTGSTGDGMRFARSLGLRVTPTYPSLVPVSCSEEYVRKLQGLSLKNVRLTVRSGKKMLFDGFGEMLFTHFGISGPLVLSLSADIGPLIGKKEMICRIDLKPAVDEEQLAARMGKTFSENHKKALRNVLPLFYPNLLAQVMPEVAGIPEDLRCCDLTKAQREALISATKSFPITLTALRGYNEAVITKGGVSVKDIKPGSMETKTCSGLYVIGELLDVDAYTGGYNLQIAWCTAAACARDVV